jgi:hypothetical protein
MGCCGLTSSVLEKSRTSLKCAECGKSSVLTLTLAWIEHLDEAGFRISHLKPIDAIAVLVAGSLYRDQEKHIMRELEVQIGNSR